MKTMPLSVAVVVAVAVASARAFVAVPGGGGPATRLIKQPKSPRTAVAETTAAPPVVESASTKPSTTEETMQYVFDFGGGKTDGDGRLKAELGGKGANLAEMARIGLPVPPGFTLSTAVCRHFYAHAQTYPTELHASVDASIARLERETGKRFGDAKNPLLVSVRSGARESMPGMMDTVLNLGLNDATVAGLSQATGDARFAADCYRRFVAMYGDVVLGVRAERENDPDPFEDAMDELKAEVGAKSDVDLNADHLMELVTRYKRVVEERTGHKFPESPREQLWGAIGAVFGSWNNDRARVYRRKYHIPCEWGTAVNVQAMVFGNLGDDSATGVAFTRNPATGANELYGEFLVNAQGEDVVAGVRTPHPLSEMRGDDMFGSSYAELERVRSVLERHFQDMQDVEFTIERGQFYVLQTRNGKRTGLAASRIAYELVRDKVIDESTAVARIPADSISALLAPAFDAEALKRATPLAQGLPAGPGAATGHVVFTARAAEAMSRKGKRAILCRVETTPEDLRGMISSAGILTTRGGVSSHAALVARQMQKVCVCGASDVHIDFEKGIMRVAGRIFREGDAISIDGSTGHVYGGALLTAPSEVSQVLNGELRPEDSYTYRIFDAVMRWADARRTLDVRANVDTPDQVKTAIKLGAEGVGLCRTEHMFFEGDRIDVFREMILAVEPTDRVAAAEKLLPYQRSDFHGMFVALEGRPITVRLLDPPLHEFLPHETSAKLALAETLGIDFATVNDRVGNLREVNPMLGHRGCRLAVSRPEIPRVQVRALFEAAAQSIAEGVPVNLEVMVPFVAFKSEFDEEVQLIRDVAARVGEEFDCQVPYTVGTMIELPRAALTADDIAETAEFFSFGTNDLTQTALGLSRDDAGTFLPKYIDKDIVKQNPFATIDQVGVGSLVRIACEKGRATRPTLKLGICGEHGGDPASVDFFHRVGLDYVSCSAPRLPVARLAAAQAAIRAAAADDDSARGD